MSDGITTTTLTTTTALHQTTQSRCLRLRTLPNIPHTPLAHIPDHTASNKKLHAKAEAEAEAEASWTVAIFPCNLQQRHQVLATCELRPGGEWTWKILLWKPLRALTTPESAQLVFKLVLRRNCSVFDLDERLSKGMRLLPQEATPPN